MSSKLAEAQKSFDRLFDVIYSGDTQHNNNTISTPPVTTNTTVTN